MTPADLRETLEAALAAINQLGPAALGDYLGSEELVTILDLIPPTTSEIIAALDDDGSVARWSALMGRWVEQFPDVGEWEECLDRCGDQPQPGYRIVRGEG